MILRVQEYLDKIDVFCSQFGVHGMADNLASVAKASITLSMIKPYVPEIMSDDEKGFLNKISAYLLGVGENVPIMGSILDNIGSIREINSKPHQVSLQRMVKLFKVLFMMTRFSLYFEL
ncbi:hypothetical protein GEMRC1_000648 [Eukaryota sp. GEM-RC1]